MKHIWDLNEPEKKKTELWKQKKKKIESKEFDSMANIFKRYSFLQGSSELIF